jgi:hypothetical protein
MPVIKGKSEQHSRRMIVLSGDFIGTQTNLTQRRKDAKKSISHTKALRHKEDGGPRLKSASICG